MHDAVDTEAPPRVACQACTFLNEPGSDICEEEKKEEEVADDEAYNEHCEHMEEHSPSDESSSDDEPIVRVKKKRQASVFKCIMAELPASVEKKEAQRRAKTTDGCSWQMKNAELS
ncbi:hypothetical protein JL722_10797 [Aureococcus anophagefferens]|nr:hypothetical protein JL722_10797 [Aureococcus anophagefferens]